MCVVYRNTSALADKLCCPVPRLYNRTRTYLDDKVRSLKKRLAVRARVLRKSRRKARWTTTPIPHGRATAMTWAANPYQETVDQVLTGRVAAGRNSWGSQTPALSPVSATSAFLPFKEMVRHEIPLNPPSTTSSQVSPRERPVSIDALLTNSLQNSDTNAVKAKSLPSPVYDGLRSSPWGSATPHVWKPYTGPVSQPKHPNKDGEDHDSNRSAVTEQSNPHHPLQNSSTPGLEEANLAIRFTPKLITHRRRTTKQLPPSTAADPFRTHCCLPLLSRPSRFPAPLPENHYTTEKNLLLLTTLPHYLPCIPPTLTPHHLLAHILRHHELRHELAHQQAVLAARINKINWQGVEAKLRKGSTERAVVEKWLKSGLPLFWIPTQGQEDKEEKEERGDWEEQMTTAAMMTMRGEVAREARGRGGVVRRAAGSLGRVVVCDA